MKTLLGKVWQNNTFKKSVAKLYSSTYVLEYIVIK